MSETVEITEQNYTIEVIEGDVTTIEVPPAPPGPSIVPSLGELSQVEISLGAVGATVEISADGPPGPIGPQGIQGETGSQGDTGPQGDQGIQGIQGVQGDTGPAGDDGEDGADGQSIFFRGDWGAGNQYVISEVVGHEGSSYGCTQDNLADPDNEPPGNPPWVLLASKGDDGDPGAAGADGADGNTVLHGIGAPDDESGEDGDFYINTTDWEMWGPKTAGTWVDGFAPNELTGPTGAQGDAGDAGAQGDTGETGEAGAAGTDGKTVLNGVDNPDGGDGTTGDFYINTVNNEIWGPKDPITGWTGTEVSVVGPEGSQGAQGESIVWEGAWALTTSYDELDMVSHGFDTYICVVSHQSGDEDDEPGVGADWADYWEVTSQSGVGFDDHGALSGLTDIADHPDYLDLGGTRPMTGDLTMAAARDIHMSLNGFIVADTDGDTYHGCGFDDIWVVITGGSNRFSVSNTGANVNGAITVTGTVDGRDVSVDGAKLDGIEAAADVTDETNVLAALAASAAAKDVGGGAITNVGLVDGYDVGTMGAKLAGIEAAADVTDFTNVLAALAAASSAVDFNGQNLTGVAEIETLSISRSGFGQIVVTNTLACDGGLDMNTNNIGACGTITMQPAATVDGYDVSVLGDKLALIEAAADVTDETNVLAALAASAAEKDQGGGNITNVGNLGIPMVERNTAQETRNNTITMTAAANMGTWELEANKSYRVTGGGGVYGSATGDMRIGFTGPAGCTVNIGSDAQRGGSNAYSNTILAFATGYQVNIWGGLPYAHIQFDGTIKVGGTPGTLTFVWAQWLATVADVYLMEGFVIEVTEIK